MADQAVTLGKIIEARTKSSPTYPAATIGTLSPTSGAAAGGTAVSVPGTNLSGTVAVLFGGVPATGVSVTSDTAVACTTPAGSLGAVDVVVVTPAGAVTKSSGYTYT